MPVSDSNKATEVRIEAAAVDQAIADVEYAEGVLSRDPFDDTQRAHAAEMLRAALRVLADAVEELRADRDYYPPGTTNLERALTEALQAAEADLQTATEIATELRARLVAAEAERDFLLSDPDNVAIKEWHDRLARQVADLEALSDKIGKFAMSHSGRDGHGVLLRALYRIGEECETALAARSRDPQEPQT